MWHLIEIADYPKTPDEDLVYYSMFCTYSSSRVYQFTFYYLRPVDDEIINYYLPVLSGFSLVVDPAAALERFL